MLLFPGYKPLTSLNKLLKRSAVQCNDPSHLNGAAKKMACLLFGAMALHPYGCQSTILAVMLRSNTLNFAGTFWNGARKKKRACLASSAACMGI